MAGRGQTALHGLCWRRVREPVTWGRHLRQPPLVANTLSRFVRPAWTIRHFELGDADTDQIFWRFLKVYRTEETLLLPDVPTKRMSAVKPTQCRNQSPMKKPTIFRQWVSKFWLLDLGSN